VADTFQQLREGLVHGSLPSLDEPWERCQRRLVQALESSGAARVGPADLAVLVRHVLCRETTHQGGASPELEVPRAAPWPARAVWEACGIKVVAIRPTSYVLRARAWHPSWLEGARTVSPGWAAFAEAARRTFDEVPGDPFLTEVGRNAYRCGAQREAVRAVLTAPPGAVLVVNLPTGAGKSLCAQLPALLKSRGGGVSVVIVPTTTLALDQERALAPFVGHPTAYYGDQAPEGQARNAAIRDRIRSGTQQVVFTSPESLAGSLAAPLHAAARDGWLRLLAIDEAHVLDEWGNEFRSAFQEVAGIRRELLRANAGEAFRTVLMTATLTPTGLRTLRTLFSDELSEFGVVSAVQLRPEPEFWAAHFADAAARRSAVLEALRHLPRPLVLYATRVADAVEWHALLRREGFLRTRLVTGKTNSTERADTIHGWTSGGVDIVVATSAFGLGMDKDDVRAVVHACVPESLNRYYQEVGRGGRDGRASVSLVAWTEQDLGMAEGMSGSTVISVGRGLERWGRMFASHETVAPGLLRVRVDVPPSYQPEDIDMTGEENRRWNVRTLTLMARAGILRLHSAPPPQRNEGEEDWNRRLAAHAARRVVEILDPGHLGRDCWNARVEPERSRSLEGERRSFSLMRRALEGKECISAFFGEAYTVETPEGSIPISPSCGGCAACRTKMRTPWAGPLPMPGPVWRSTREPQPELAALFAGATALAVFYDIRAMRPRTLRRLVRWLVSQGVQTLVLPEESAERLMPLRHAVLEGAAGEPCFVLERFDSLLAPRAPALVLHSPGDPLPATYLRATTPGRPAPRRVLLLPEDVLDPDGRGPLWDRIAVPAFSFDELCTLRGL
jgi:ATP-dependent DNA helicase RecQ